MICPRDTILNVIIKYVRMIHSNIEYSYFDTDWGQKWVAREIKN